VNKIKLPSTMIRDARFRDKNEITDKKLYTNQSRVYKNKYFEDIIIDDSSAEVVYNNTDNLSTFKQLLMLDTYRDLRTYYSRTLYLDSESMRQVEI
jgi:hypothetical protein